MWVQGGDVGKDRETGNSCSILGGEGGTGCIIGAVVQHPWAGRWFCSPGIEIPLGWEPAQQEKGSAALLAPSWMCCCFGGRCSTLAQS